MSAKGIKDLDTIVGGITDDDMIIVVGCNALWTVEQSILCARRSKGSQKLSLFVKHLDAIFGSVRDNDEGILSHLQARHALG